MFGQRIAPGLMIQAIAGGLLLPADTRSVIANYGMDRLRFPVPTFIGDTIHVELEVVEKEERDLGGLAHIEWRVLNQNETLVLTCVNLALFAIDPPGGRSPMSSGRTHHRGPRRCSRRNPRPSPSHERRQPVDAPGAVVDVRGGCCRQRRCRCLVLTGAGAGLLLRPGPLGGRTGRGCLRHHLRDHHPGPWHSSGSSRNPTTRCRERAAMGVGLGLAVNCDLVIAADNARPSTPFADLEVALDSGGHFHLPRLVGLHRALEDGVHGRRHPRPVQAVGVGTGEPLGRWAAGSMPVVSRRMADRIAAGPTLAFRRQKELLRRSASMSWHSGQRGRGPACRPSWWDRRLRRGPSRLHREAAAPLPRPMSVLARPAPAQRQPRRPGPHRLHLPRHRSALHLG